jgi:hypothetical protein
MESEAGEGEEKGGGAGGTGGMGGGAMTRETAGLAAKSKVAITQPKPRVDRKSETSRPSGGKK